MRRSNSERTEGTRAALINAARGLFVMNGYADTATPEIAAAAGVTRGALYHHFADKKALFAAVLVEEARMVREEIETAAFVAENAREAILAGTRGYFDAMSAPGRTRLLLLDGPAVLGARSLQQIDAEHSERSLKAGLAALFGESGKAPDRLDVTAELLSAAFDRAALAIEAGGWRDDYEKAIASLIDGLAVK